ncbi:MAG: hypothetical protein ACTTIF_08665 [Prevotella sp.]
MTRICLSFFILFTFSMANAESVEQTSYVGFGENNVNSHDNLTVYVDRDNKIIIAFNRIQSHK